GRRGIDVPPLLLDVLAVVALRAGEAEQPFLEDRVGAVPECKREAPGLMVVADAGEAVLAPAVGPRPGGVVRDVVPGRAAVAVVLADGSPLPLADVRTPPAPGDGLGVGRG